MSFFQRVFAITFLVLAVSSARSQSVSGSTTVDIDPDTGMVTVTCETDVDEYSQGYYQPMVACVLTDGNGNSLQAGQETDWDGETSAIVVLQIQGIPGTTYVGTGRHLALLIVPVDDPEDDPCRTCLLDEYNFQEISDEFFNDGTPYPFPIVFYGPGPEEDTSAHVLLIADTTATGVDPQIPGALSVLSSPAITYKTPYANGCPVTAPYGASLAITYQVLDSSSQHAAIANSNMEPKEQTSSLVINGVARGSGPVPNWQDIGPSTYSFDGSPVPGTSKFTNAQGQFLDAAFQECATDPVTVTVTQTIRVLFGGSAYVVRTNN